MIYPNQSLERQIFASDYQLVVALDEVGRGALAGPLVAVAVALDFSQIRKVKRLVGTIRESKLLSVKARQKIFEKIYNKLPWSLGRVSHSEIDQLGISKANVLAFQRALDNLPLEPDYLLLDYVYGFKHTKPFQLIIDGDYKVFSIALASILAKVSRDRMMRDYHFQYPAYNFNRHKGYGTKLHQQCLKKYGPCQIHRHSFRLNNQAFN